MALNGYPTLPVIPGSGQRRNPIPEGATLDQIWPELKKRVEEISKNTNLEGEYCMADCGYIHSACKVFCKGDYSNTFFQRISSVKLVQLFGQCWQGCLNEQLFHSWSDKYYALVELSGALTALTDQSDVICAQFLQYQIYRTLLQQLASAPLKAGKMNEPMRSSVAIGHVMILHNVLKKLNVAKRTYRAVSGAVQILQPFRVCANLALATLATMVQSYIITDRENELINNSEDSFKPIVNTLAQSIKGQISSAIKINLPPIEILSVINNLANTNDNNSTRLVQAGALQHYADVLKDDFGVDCQAESTKGLWTYALSCPQQIDEEGECLQGLNRLTEHEDEAVRKNAEGALWVIHNPVMNPPVRKPRLSLSSSAASLRSPEVTLAQPPLNLVMKEEHMFISYQWDNKTEAKQIADRTKSEGMKVWIDVDNMRGSVMDGMAEAVEKASLIIVLISQKYKDSMNCRSEAQYAFRLHKRVVPVRAEKGYEADGWLGLLIGSQRVIDITDLTRLEESMIEILREIRPDPSKTVPALTPPAPPPSGINGDIARWLQAHGITHLSKWFEGLDEPLLKELASLRKEAAAEFFISLRQEQMSLSDRLRLSLALKKTFQL